MLDFFKRMVGMLSLSKAIARFLEALKVCEKF
jgi:hypothetical protein